MIKLCLYSAAFFLTAIICISTHAENTHFHQWKQHVLEEKIAQYRKVLELLEKKDKAFDLETKKECDQKIVEILNLSPDRPLPTNQYMSNLIEQIQTHLHNFELLTPEQQEKLAQKFLTWHTLFLQRSAALKEATETLEKSWFCHENDLEKRIAIRKQVFLNHLAKQFQCCKSMNKYMGMEKQLKNMAFVNDPSMNLLFANQYKSTHDVINAYFNFGGPIARTFGSVTIRVS